MSLFGNFYERIHGSQEYLASESLNYILNSSKKTNDNLIKHISHDNRSNYSDISFKSQVQGEDNEIPDLSGFDNNGKEVIILETKFWASLTKNQPGTYLKRLADNGVLVFICPGLRVESLKGEIINALKNEKITFTDEDKRIRLEKKSILIYSWKTVLDTMEIDIGNSEFEVRADILQLRGLCERIDNDSFLPISEEDLSPSIPKRILSYVNIVEKVIQKLVSNEIVDKDGFRKTGQAYGCTFYCGVKPLQLALEVNLKNWAKYADTPIWLNLSIIGSKEKNPELIKLNNKIQKKYDISDYGDKKYINYPIRITPGEIEESLFNSIYNFVKDVVEKYKELM